MKITINSAIYHIEMNKQEFTAYENEKEVLLYDGFSVFVTKIEELNLQLGKMLIVHME